MKYLSMTLIIQSGLKRVNGGLMGFFIINKATLIMSIDPVSDGAGREMTPAPLVIKETLRALQGGTLACCSRPKGR